MAGQPDDTWISSPKHLDSRAAAQPELRKLVNMVRMAKNLRDASAMTDRKLL